MFHSKTIYLVSCICLIASTTAAGQYFRKGIERKENYFSETPAPKVILPVSTLNTNFSNPSTIHHFAYYQSKKTVPIPYSIPANSYYSEQLKSLSPMRQQKSLEFGQRILWMGLEILQQTRMGN